MAHAPRRSRTTRTLRLLAASATVAGVVAGASVAEAQVVTTTTSTSSTTSSTASTTTSTAAPTTTTTTAATTTTTEAPTTPDDDVRPAPPGASSTVSAGSVNVGGTITVSGTGCSTDGVPGGAVVVIGNPPDGPFLDDVKEANADGTWSITFTVPTNFPTGPTLVRSGCLDDPGADSGFVYAESTVNVLPAAATPIPGTPRYTG